MRKFAWEIGWLMLVGSLFFIPHWLAGRVYGTFDLSHISVPIEDIFARYQSHGEIPIWTREFQGGFPMMANGFQSFFYLPHVLLRAVFSGIWVVNISLLLHMWLAAVGMWLLLKQQKIPPPAAALGALMFSAGGYFVGRTTLPHLFFPAAWIPLIFWAVFCLWRKPNLRNACLLAVIWAAQVFSGHIQMAIYTSLMVGIVVLANIAQSLCPRSRSLLRNAHLARGLAPALLFFIVMTAVYLLTAVHILPTQELLPLSRRALPTTLEEAFDVSYPLKHLLTWIKPDYFGHQENYRGAKNEPELMTYFGLAGLFLGIIGLANKKTWHESLGQSSLGLIIVGFVLAGGGYSPVFRWLHSLPTPFAQLANPGRTIVFVHVGWSILAAYGAAWLLERKIPARWLYVVFTAAAVELFIAGWPVNPVVPAAAWAHPPAALQYLPTRTDAPRAYSHYLILAGPGSDFAPSVGPKLERSGIFRQTFIPQRDELNGIDVQLTWNGEPSEAGIVELKVVDAAGQVLRSSEIAGRAIGDGELVRFAFPPLTGVKQTPLRLELTSNYPAAYAPRLNIATNTDGSDFNPTGELNRCITGNCQRLQGGDGQTLDLSFTTTYASQPVILDRELLVPIFGESFSQEMIRGHMTLQLLRVYNYLFQMGEKGNFEAQDLVGRRDLLDRFSAGTIIASYEENRDITGMPNLELLAQLPAGERYVHIYRNNQAYPLISLPHHAVLKKDDDAVRAALINHELAPDEVAVEGLTPPADLAADSQASFTLKQRTSRLTEVAVDSSSPQLLVIRDVIYPGWQATIDNQPNPLYYVDSLFQGVLVPAGNHDVVIWYHSKPFQTGAWISGLGWVLIGGFLIQQTFQRRQSIADGGRKGN